MNKKMYKFLTLLLVLMAMGFNLLAQSEHCVAGKMYIDSLLKVSNEVWII